MKPSRNLFLRRALLTTAATYARRVLLTLAAGSALSLPVHATVMYWDGNGTLSTNWNNTASLYALADGSNPTAAASVNDDVVFVYSGLDNTMYLSQVTGTINVRSLTFNNTGISQIRAASASRILSIGAGGITVNSGAGAVLLGRSNGTTGSVTLTFKLAADQTWTNNDNDTLDFFYDGNGSAIDTNGKVLSLAGTGNFSLDTRIAGIGSLIKGGSGTATIGNAYGATGANTYSGGTTINEGILIIQGSNAIADSGAVSLADTAGATLQLNASETIGSLAGGGTTGGNVNLQANNLAVGDANNTSYSGVISGINGSLTKSGDGTLTLNANNTYNGNTLINSGTIALSNTGGLNFKIGADDMNNKISGTGAGTVSLDGIFTFDLTTASTTINDSWNIVDVANLFESYGANFTIFGFTPVGGGDLWNGSANGASYQFSETSGVLTVIPEPSAALLGGLGLLALLRRRRA